MNKYQEGCSPCPKEVFADAALQPRQSGHAQRPQQPYPQRPGPRFTELRELLPQPPLQCRAALPQRRRKAPRPGIRERLLQPLQSLEGDVLESHEVDHGALTLLGPCGNVERGGT